MTEPWSCRVICTHGDKVNRIDVITYQDDDVDFPVRYDAEGKAPRKTSKAGPRVSRGGAQLRTRRGPHTRSTHQAKEAKPDGSSKLRWKCPCGLDATFSWQFLDTLALGLRRADKRTVELRSVAARLSK